MQATASLFRSPFDMRPGHLEHHKSTEIEAIGQAKYLTKGQDEPEKQKATPKNGLTVLFYWCPRTESNRYLMITNQLHDLHATGARCIGVAL